MERMQHTHTRGHTRTRARSLALAAKHVARQRDRAGVLRPVAIRAAKARRPQLTTLFMLTLSEQMALSLLPGDELLVECPARALPPRLAKRFEAREATAS